MEPFLGFKSDLDGAYPRVKDQRSEGQDCIIISSHFLVCGSKRMCQRAVMRIRLNLAGTQELSLNVHSIFT